MLCLSMETSTKTCSVALVDDNKTLGEIRINSEHTHSQKLMPAVDMLLKSVEKKLDDVELIGVAVGPGSFTGLRIGISTAKGLAYGRKIPVVGISTLEGLALSTNNHEATVVPILNARRNQVYTAIFKYNISSYARLLEDSIIKLDELIGKLNELEGEFIFTGDGVPVFSEQITMALGDRAKFISQYNCIPSAVSIGQIALEQYKLKGGDDPFTLKPEYLRLSEAERNILKGCS
ncbi:tRNA (adenosine(37)-N6)-threonylcarbamoyltransferase complex dimerization subunit type 1 TsaB [Alkalicella caledoniensis]|uniref:tRNA (Adenosine(37)-N6)-threonylcarbamoyltransferase complex dimerization subunit type 1 TsaB n=1 Tax=Alkalicella caledoniensis TaxID=2731377 RepID=A0A7G9W784_ALKCA|nr:tRNA (adenosine(37)-N6)-threonylcarbamoyltransferase complex dimerization subunit type 1 TsaB [Alkalicella caledoniensis]QNO14546.1 tRNA (adenosine(37)-N6)-threonylcarbamoyltransferase complex dimerization subunit type 1 TsaB [Alkalicella caledoniensis]